MRIRTKLIYLYYFKNSAKTNFSLRLDFSVVLDFDICIRRTLSLLLSTIAVFTEILTAKTHCEHNLTFKEKKSAELAPNNEKSNCHYQHITQRRKNKHCSLTFSKEINRNLKNNKSSN